MKLLALALPGALLAVLVLSAASLWWNGREAPTREEVAADLILGEELIAYEVIDGVPYVVFSRSKVTIDRLKRDWIAKRFPPAPAWQLTGNWYGINRTRDPASVGVSRCTGGESGSFAAAQLEAEIPFDGCSGTTQVFGEVTDAAIVSLEIRYEGAWRRYPVSMPGYVVSLAPFGGVPDGYRWLNRSGEVVWESGLVPELLWD
jgi:hypothetical protein